MSTVRTLRHSPLALILLIVAAATAVKWTWALFSRGTCDAMFFFVFARLLNEGSLAGLYQTSDLFNHTPFTGYLMVGLLKLAQGDYGTFAANLRLLSIIADIAVVAGLLQMRRRFGTPPWWALALFAASPVSIMVSGFHGNVDPIMVAFLFFAAFAAISNQPVRSGLLYASACNVKVVPLLIAPFFLLYWWNQDRRAALRFMAASGIVMLAGVAVPLIQCPAPFAKNVLGYGSLWGGWGITNWLRIAGWPGGDTVSFRDLTVPQMRIMSALKFLIISGILVLAWRRRHSTGIAFIQSIAAAFAVFFALSPGVGVQYMTWFAPFLLVIYPRWWAVITAGATCFLFAFYHSTSKFHFPWDLAFPAGTEVPYWAPWTNLPWIAFVALVATQWKTWFNASQPTVEAPASSEPALAVEAPACA